MATCLQSLVVGVFVSKIKEVMYKTCTASCSVRHDYV